MLYGCTGNEAILAAANNSLDLKGPLSLGMPLLSFRSLMLTIVGRVQCANHNHGSQ